MNMTQVMKKCAAGVAMGLFAANAAMGAPKYQAELSVSGYAGTEELTDFPVLVRISADKISGFAYGQCAATDGSDISFVDADGNVLSHEVDTWNTAGESTVWVRIPSLVKGTTFRMRWGDSSPASVTANTTWNTNYVGVWHMGEESGTCANSSQCGSKYDATPCAELNAEAAKYRYSGTDAPVGYARTTATASGVNNAACLAVPSYDKENVQSNFTISGWVYIPTWVTRWPRIFARKLTYNTTGGWECQFENGQTTLRVRGNSASKTFDTTVATGWVGSWTHFAFTFSNTTCSVYMNGKCLNTNSSLDAPTDNGQPLGIGCIATATGGNTGGSHVVGSYDECRLMKGAASADWVKAEYDSVTSASFLTVGAAKSTMNATANVTGGTWKGVDVTFNESSSSRQLTVVWGAEDKGATSTGWDGSTTVEIAAGAKSLEYTDLPSGWGTTVKVIRFGFAADGLWTDAVEWYEASAPQLGAIALAVEGGNTIKVSGSVTSFPGENCVVKAWVGTSEESLAEWPDVSQTLTTAGKYELTLTSDSMVPGQTYYVKVKATSNGESGESEVASITTVGASVTVAAVNAAFGTVTMSPKKDSYMDGETVTITFTPATGVTFTGWTGDVADDDKTNATITITAKDGMSLSPWCQAPFWVYENDELTDGEWVLEASGAANAITVVKAKSYQTTLVSSLQNGEKIEAKLDLRKEVKGGTITVMNSFSRTSVGKELLLPDTVTRIEYRAFLSQESWELKRTRIWPLVTTNVTFVGAEAFKGQNAMTGDVAVGFATNAAGASVETELHSGGLQFMDCNKIGPTVSIGPGVYSIPTRAFWSAASSYGDGMVEVWMDANVTNAAATAFYNFHGNKKTTFHMACDMFPGSSAMFYNGENTTATNYTVRVMIEGANAKTKNWREYAANADYVTPWASLTDDQKQLYWTNFPKETFGTKHPTGLTKAVQDTTGLPPNQWVFIANASGLVIRVQ